MVVGVVGWLLSRLDSCLSRIFLSYYYFIVHFVILLYIIILLYHHFAICLIFIILTLDAVLVVADVVIEVDILAS